MSKKSVKFSLIEILSFVGIIACATCLALGKAGLGGSIIGTVSNACLLVSAVLASWNFVLRSSTVTKIIYFVCVVVIIVLWVI